MSERAYVLVKVTTPPLNKHGAPGMDLPHRGSETRGVARPPGLAMHTVGLHSARTATTRRQGAQKEYTSCIAINAAS